MIQKHVRLCGTLVAGMLMCLGAAQAPAVVIDTESVPLCFGAGFASPSIADVVTTSPGKELLVTVIDQIVKADLDIDGKNEVLAELSVKAVARDGTVLWRSPVLAVKSEDVAIPVPIANTYVLPVLDEPAELLFSSGTFCSNSGFAVEHGGQQYVAVVAGFLAQEGTLLAGTDYSKVFVWILNRDTGTIVKKHKLLARADKYLVGFNLTAFADLDSDSDDELIAYWAIPTGDGRFTLLYESYDLLSGVQEDRFQVYGRSTVTFE